MYDARLRVCRIARAFTYSTPPHWRTITAYGCLGRKQQEIEKKKLCQQIERSYPLDENYNGHSISEEWLIDLHSWQKLDKTLHCKAVDIAEAKVCHFGKCTFCPCLQLDTLCRRQCSWYLQVHGREKWHSVCPGVAKSVTYLQMVLWEKHPSAENCWSGQYVSKTHFQLRIEWSVLQHFCFFLTTTPVSLNQLYRGEKGVNFDMSGLWFSFLTQLLSIQATETLWMSRGDCQRKQCYLCI